MTPEGRVKEIFINWLSDQPLTMIWGFMPVKRAEGVSGIPDWCGCIHGEAVYVEFKADGETPRGLQLVVHQDIERAGGTVYVADINNIEHVIWQLEEKMGR
jgi:hypothetical protein